MKFLIDAQLPPALKKVFTSQGYDCIYTLDLEYKNETPDELINQISVSQQRILITKDTDFINSYLLKKEPYKLILVKLGNTTKNDLIFFFRKNLHRIIEMIRSEDILVLK